MRQRPFLRRVAQEHADDCPHVVLYLDDEDLLVVADEDGATAVGGEDSANLNGHHVVLHHLTLLPKPQKTSPVNTRNALSAARCCRMITYELSGKDHPLGQAPRLAAGYPRQGLAPCGHQRLF